MIGLCVRVASFRGNSQTTPNLNVPTNRRFQTTGFQQPHENDIDANKTVNALATLRRQNNGHGTNSSAAASTTKRPILGIEFILLSSCFLHH